MARNKIYIPTFISSVNYAPARVLPHIYFYNGLKVCETYYLQGYANGNTGSVTSNALESFPYFDNYEGQDPTSGSRSLLFFNEPAVYGTTPTGSLYTNYWERYINLLYNPRTRLFNCEAIIPLADYFKMELNDIVEWRGNYYHLRAINDYNLSNGECKLQLLGPILDDIMTDILERDCSFNFVVEDSTEYRIEYLIVGGGGGGGRTGGGGIPAGGGAGGGVFSGSMFIPTGSAYTIIVGAGGAGFVAGSGPGGTGDASSAFGYTVLGGGGGGGGSTANGLSGSSGGGGAYNGIGGSGSIGFGNIGGNGNSTGGLNNAGGGGGGAASAGGNATAIAGGFRGGAGGSGSAGLINVGTFWYGAGGGGGGRGELANSCGPGGSPTFAGGSMGGRGGGNVGCNPSGLTGFSGTVSGYGAGGGGGGSSTTAGGRGGNGSGGSVWIRYPGSVQRGTGGDVQITGSYVYHSFTTSGTYNS